MSHYLVGVILPKPPAPDVGATVARLLAPHEGEHWDWYQIGGRWTGHVSGYVPETDPRNHEPCWLCQGTGKRTDMLGIAERLKNPAYTCNGCQGIGQMLKHPTQWAPSQNDVAPVQSALDRQVAFYAIVTPDGVWHQRTVEYGDTFFKPTEAAWREREAAHIAAWKAECRHLLEDHDLHLLVVVDCHN